MKQVKVLDKGHVDYVDHMGTDLTVCNAARVSFNNESEWGLDFDAIERLKSCPYNKVSCEAQSLDSFRSSANHPANQSTSFYSHSIL